LGGGLTSFDSAAYPTKLCEKFADAVMKGWLDDWPDEGLVSI